MTQTVMEVTYDIEEEKDRESTHHRLDGADLDNIAEEDEDNFDGKANDDVHIPTFGVVAAGLKATPVGSPDMPLVVSMENSSPGNLRRASFDDEESKDDQAGAKRGRSKFGNLMASVMNPSPSTQPTPS